MFTKMMWESVTLKKFILAARCRMMTFQFSLCVRITCRAYGIIYESILKYISGTLPTRSIAQGPLIMQINEL